MSVSNNFFVVAYSQGLFIRVLITLFTSKINSLYNLGCILSYLCNFLNCLKKEKAFSYTTGLLFIPPSPSQELIQLTYNYFLNLYIDICSYKFDRKRLPITATLFFIFYKALLEVLLVLKLIHFSPVLYFFALRISSEFGPLCLDGMVNFIHFYNMRDLMLSVILIEYK